MTYRERAVEVMKLAGKELAERAEELIPDAKRVKDLNIWIRVPSLTDEITYPEIEVEVSVYPTRQMVDVYQKIVEGPVDG